MSIERMKKVGQESRKKMGIPIAVPKNTLYPSTVIRVKNREEERKLAEAKTEGTSTAVASANPSAAIRGKNQAEIEAQIRDREAPPSEDDVARKNTSISASAGIADMGAMEDLADRKTEESQAEESKKPAETTKASIPPEGTPVHAIDTREYFSELTVKELKAFAEEYVIDIDKQLTKKADIVDCVAKAFKARIEEANDAEPWTELLQKTMDYYGAIVRTNQ